MRNEILLYLNGERTVVSGADAFLTLSDYLREVRRKVGTKIVCEEGDCGACTVLLGRPDSGRIAYRSVNSCIYFVYQADGCHVITVEGLKRNGMLHPVQQALVQAHGTQCGFCTPGFAVAMAGLFHNRRAAALQNGHILTHQDLRDSVTGNLCRCTGYESILRAGLSVEENDSVNLDHFFPPNTIAAELQNACETACRVVDGDRSIDIPVSTSEAAAFKSAGAVVVSGATDIGVQHNKRGFAPKKVVSLGHIPDLAGLTSDSDAIHAGAAVSLSDLEDLARIKIPELQKMLWVFGAPQIRNAGTLGGNIVNASPIADTVPFLFVAGAELEIAGSGTSRRVPIQNFYRGYKDFDLGPGEILARIHIPIPLPTEHLRLYKVSRRKHLDISSFSLALRIRTSGTTIEEATVAVGGAAPTVIRLPKTEELLRGHALSEETFASAGKAAREEIRPISDVRGAGDYRKTLAENLMHKAYFDLAGLEVVK